MNEDGVSTTGRVDELERTVREMLALEAVDPDPAMWGGMRRDANTALGELAVIARDGQRAREELDGDGPQISMGTAAGILINERKVREAAEARIAELEIQVKVAAIGSNFWNKVEIADNGCWEWQAHRNAEGYGTVEIARKHWMAHRASYHAINGPIPAGMEIDHLCRNRACVNPAHLEAVTPRENTLRSDAITAQNARKTHCKHGHEFTDENTIIDPRGGRGCRTCHNKRTAESKRRKRAEARAALSLPSGPPETQEAK